MGHRTYPSGALLLVTFTPAPILHCRNSGGARLVRHSAGGQRTDQDGAPYWSYSRRRRSSTTGKATARCPGDTVPRDSARITTVPPYWSRSRRSRSHTAVTATALGSSDTVPRDTYFSGDPTLQKQRRRAARVTQRRGTAYASWRCQDRRSDAAASRSPRTSPVSPQSPSEKFSASTRASP